MLGKLEFSFDNNFSERYYLILDGIGFSFYLFAFFYKHNDMWEHVIKNYLCRVYLLCRFFLRENAMEESI